ncbi:barstar family protein [Streptomyces sp. NPDC006656]|uniref:barstar family protein n=1 Tax=Streptomyces sp. NPDC006656 TaxID=3156899 RepID=UPI00345167B4
MRLEDRGFRVINLAAGEWASEQDMHKDVAAALQFPDYYGHNLDAFNDCLGDVACYGPYDDVAEGTGLVLSITDYDRFLAACPRAAQVVLDIVADQARPPRSRASAPLLLPHPQRRPRHPVRTSRSHARHVEQRRMARCQPAGLRWAVAGMSGPAASIRP